MANQCSGEQTKLDNICDGFLDYIMDYYDLPGVALGVVAGSFDYQGVRGYGNYENKTRLKPETVFHCTSITKLFTSMAVMLLAEKNLLDISSKTVDIIPSISIADKRWREVSVETLLSHRSGLADVSDYRWELHETAPQSLYDYLSSEEVLSLKLIGNPGEKFRYSNLGYSILGQVIAEIAGTSFEEFMKKEILNPLKMYSSTLLTSERTGGSLCFADLQKAGLAMPHKRDMNKNIVLESVFPYSRRHGPSSTLTSTASDMNRWMRAVMNLEVVSAETCNKMFKGQINIPGTSEQMGMGWFIREYEKCTLYGHEGSDDGFRTSLWICPEKELGLCLMCNMTDAPLKKLSNKLFSLLMAGLNTADINL